MIHIQELWSQTLDSIQNKISKPSFETWLKATEAINMENDILIVCAPNDFARDWLESRYADLVRDTLKEVTGGSKIGVKFVSQTQEKTIMNP